MKHFFGGHTPYGEFFHARFSLCVFVQKNLGSTMQRGFEKHGVCACFRALETTGLGKQCFFI